MSLLAAVEDLTGLGNLVPVGTLGILITLLFRSLWRTDSSWRSLVTAEREAAQSARFDAETARADAAAARSETAHLRAAMQGKDREIRDLQGQLRNVQEQLDALRELIRQRPSGTVSGDG